MTELLHAIDQYWTNRAPGYSEVNQEELSGRQKRKWQQELVSVIARAYPDRAWSTVKVLDIGTGPGFFAIILAEAGFQVTAVDYTWAMLAEARRNAGQLGAKIAFLQMDGQKLALPEASFEVVVSRNLTWVLEQPEKAYADWLRVLKPGGLLLNFDANWYGYLFDPEKKRQYELDRQLVKEQALHDEYLETDIPEMENIARRVPLSSRLRPGWDEEVLRALKVQEVQVDTQAWQRLWSEAEKVNYASTPMFLIKVRK